LKKLTDYRNKIDDIDKRIVDLLNRRAKIATDIGGLKSKSKLEVYDPRREAEIMKKLRKLESILPEESLRAIFTEIISASRALERKPVVSYLGPKGTFSHEAALALFGSSCDLRPASGWEGVFTEVEKELADFGVLPIENSIEGSVNLSLDLLAESSLLICAEKSIPAHQNLISNCADIASIKKLYSHTQPLSQCRKFISRNLPNVQLLETSSTAAAAEKAAKTKNSAAIASLTAAKIYGLGVLRQRIQDFPNNITRFMVLAKIDAERKPGGKYKTSIVLTLKNRTGALYRLLGAFESKKINLTKIVSRPLPRATWAYLFYIDFEGHRRDAKVAEVLKKAASLSEELKALGSYPVEGKK